MKLCGMATKPTDCSSGFGQQLYIHEHTEVKLIRPSVQLQIRWFSMGLSRQLFGIRTRKYCWPNKFLRVQQHIHRPYRYIVTYTCTGDEKISVSNTSKIRKHIFAQLNTIFVKYHFLDDAKYKEL